MAIIAVSIEYEIQYDAASDNESEPRWLHWSDTTDEAEADRWLASAMLQNLDLRMRKIRITREVYGDDPPA